MPAFSPDGRWLAYVSDESGEEEVYVQPFPGPGAKSRISTNGGLEPVWARSGRELFFRHRDQIMVTEINTQPAFNSTRPKVLFAGSFAQSPSRYNYDVSRDGQRFVMLNAGEDERTPTQINVLLNWFEELKQKVPIH
jgi:serine/threonine-protein kinase